MADARGLALVALLAGAAAAQQDAFAFMPPGGRDILRTLVAGDTGMLAEAAARTDDRAGWADWIRQRAPEMDERQAETFAAYAALNLPVAADVLARVAEAGDPALLPPDGKELAIQQCQYCHSLFSGYLMHDRDETGWRSIFKAPFHLEIPMTDVERDTFAAYSAINMPMRLQDVPPDLRF